MTDESSAPLSLPARPELTGGRRIGVMVSHGFTGSPHSVRPWALSLAERGYAVELPLLPGHGSTWQEMNTTTWEDWYGAVRAAHDKLAEENDDVLVAGLSMGGTLALRLAADLGDAVAGVIVVNAAVATRRKDVLVLPFAKHVLGSLPAIGNDLKKNGVDERAYDRTPLRAAHSMMQAWKVLRDDLPRVTAPVLFFKSAVDHVVDDSSLPIVRAGVSSREFIELVLPDSYHVATLDNDAQTIFDESAAFVARVTDPANGRTGPRSA
ncbi:alpha/beta fold hydrolase [Nocardioides sp. Y6]|uniref:Alpha/beta fold hydrolase n=1 Tax=Nocardioides malaquae TaxID=2773426 RepID=A0ABR9RPW9_9ACTN|nr:alpha/beta fold hydrolase [Nocardioides malaquae]MBE7323267.1 alpha/beta fold hydrolase [Nocardioides malaquae]